MNITELAMLKKMVGGGNGGGIIDVVELPTENIDEQSIYRVDTNGTYTYHACKNGVWVEFVTKSGETFESAFVIIDNTNGNEGHKIIYINSEGVEEEGYCARDEEAYCNDVKTETELQILGNYSSADLYIDGGNLISSHESGMAIMLPNNASDTLRIKIID